jgi:hypothetical protein
MRKQAEQRKIPSGQNRLLMEMPRTTQHRLAARMSIVTPKLRDVKEADRDKALRP